MLQKEQQNTYVISQNYQNQLKCIHLTGFFTYRFALKMPIMCDENLKAQSIRPWLFFFREGAVSTNLKAGKLKTSKQAGAK